MKPRQRVTDGAHFIRPSGQSPSIYGGLSGEALRQPVSRWLALACQSIGFPRLGVSRSRKCSCVRQAVAPHFCSAEALSSVAPCRDAPSCKRILATTRSRLRFEARLLNCNAAPRLRCLNPSFLIRLRRFVNLSLTIPTPFFLSTVRETGPFLRILIPSL